MLSARFERVKFQFPYYRVKWYPHAPSPRVFHCEALFIPRLSKNEAARYTLRLGKCRQYLRQSLSWNITDWCMWGFEEVTEGCSEGEKHCFEFCEVVLFISKFVPILSVRPHRGLERRQIYLKYPPPLRVRAVFVGTMYVEGRLRETWDTLSLLGWFMAFGWFGSSVRSARIWFFSENQWRHK